MPKSKEILDTLQSVVDNNLIYAIFWHAVFYILLAFLISAWKPSNQLFGIFLVVPVVSVAIFAWISGNPFNGTVFWVVAILLLIFGLRASPDPVTLSSLPFLMAGVLMVIFGLIYPHFVTEGSILKYLYASPAGLIPCPTLSIIIGFALIYNGFGSPAITITLLVAGLFYGIFGALKLAVYVDFFLVSGTLALLIKFLIRG